MISRNGIEPDAACDENGAVQPLSDRATAYIADFSIGSIRSSLGKAALLAVMGLSACQRHPNARNPHEFSPATTVAPDIHHRRSGEILAEIRRMGVFDKDLKWAITASSEAFTNLGNRFAQTVDGRELLTKQELNILVPASGFKLSQLDMVFAMLNRQNSVKGVKLTFTEIDEDAYRLIDRNIRALDQAWEGIGNVSVMEKIFDGKDVQERMINDTPVRAMDENAPLRSALRDADLFSVAEKAHLTLLPKQKKISFIYTNRFGKNIEFEINFEYRMSGRRYFRTESGNEADIIILDDVGDTISRARGRNIEDNTPEFNAFEHDANLAIDYATPAWNKKTHYVVIDIFDKVNSRGIGGQVVRDLNNAYGCGNNHLDIEPTRPLNAYMGRGAEIIRVDTELLRAILLRGGEKALHAYAFLMAGNFHDKGDEGRRLLSNHEIRNNLRICCDLYQTLEPSDVKNMIGAVVRGFMSRNRAIYRYIDSETSNLIKRILIESGEPGQGLRPTPDVDMALPQ